MSGSAKATVILRAMALLVSVALPAIAAPPPGTDLSSPEHEWWSCHHQPKNDISCCSEADGHALNDAEWREVDGNYQVRVEGKWFPVPADTILSGDNCGPDPAIDAQSEAKVWYTRTRDMNSALLSVNVLCFIAGQLY